MMINPGDSSAVFALLTAIASPEEAKASLQEILSASAEYQKHIEDFRAESAKTNSDLSDLKNQADAQFAAAKEISDAFAITSAQQTKDISNRETSVGNREAVVRGKEDSLQAREAVVSQREGSVSSREQNVQIREDAVSKLNSDTEALKALYTNKLSAIKNLIAS
jgi:uncharacterized protein (DUF3084 family)